MILKFCKEVIALMNGVASRDYMQFQKLISRSLKYKKACLYRLKFNDKINRDK